MQIDKLNHIEILREDTIRQYKFYSNPAAPKPPLRNRQLHGWKIKTEFEYTSNLINSQRSIVGIEPGKLLILNFSSNSMSPDMMNNMIRKFNLSLIEEVQDPETSNILMLVQFADLESISSFKSEQELWTVDSPYDGILTYAQRRDIFSCIECIRSLRREDRIGPRLKKFIESGQPFAEGFFIVDIDVWHDGDRSKMSPFTSHVGE